MTEIDERFLVRGKRVDNGEWIEGYLFRLSESLNPFIMLWKQSGSFFAIDINTIGQCTGVKDKNGTRVFEGDILKLSKSSGADCYPPKPKVVVKWNLHSWCWEVAGEEKCYISYVDTWRRYKFEVIGNIHDNLELLDGEKNV